MFAAHLQEESIFQEDAYHRLSTLTLHGDVVGSVFVPKTEHKVSQNCEDAPQSAGSYRAVVYDTDSSGSIVGKHPLFVLDSAFVIHTPAGPLATLQTTSFGK